MIEGNFKKSDNGHYGFSAIKLADDRKADEFHEINEGERKVMFPKEGELDA